MSFLGTGSIPECAKSKHWPSPRTYDYDSPLCPGGGVGRGVSAQTLPLWGIYLGT